MGKFAILKNFCDERRDFISEYGNKEKETYRKVILSYFVNCILKKKDNFSISYGSKKEKVLNDHGSTTIKIPKCPDEYILDTFLQKNGFEVIDEDVDFKSIAYNIERTN